MRYTRATMDNDSDRASGHLTAFAGAETALVESCAAAPVNGTAFAASSPVARCANAAEPAATTASTSTMTPPRSFDDSRPTADEFREMGLNLPDAVIVHEQWRGSDPAAKAAVKTISVQSVVEDYPAHFNDTACVFLLEDALRLQVLAERMANMPGITSLSAAALHPISGITFHHPCRMI